MQSGCFTTLPLGRLPRKHMPRQKLHPKTQGEKRSLEKRVHINRNCIAYVASLKTLREKPSSKNSQKEKEHNNKPSWLHIILYLLFFMNRDQSSRLCMNFMVLATMIYKILNNQVVHLHGKSKINY